MAACSTGFPVSAMGAARPYGQRRPAGMTAVPGMHPTLFTGCRELLGSTGLLPLLNGHISPHGPCGSGEHRALPGKAVLLGVTAGCASARSPGAAGEGSAAPGALRAGSPPGEISLFIGNPVGRSGAWTLLACLARGKPISPSGLHAIRAFSSPRGRDGARWLGPGDGGPHPRSPAARSPELCFLSFSRPLSPPLPPPRSVSQR